MSIRYFNQEFVDEVQRIYGNDVVITHDNFMWESIAPQFIHGYHLSFKSGLTVSIQFGPATYSTFHDAIEIFSNIFIKNKLPTEPLTDRAEQAEIAYYYGEGDLQEFKEDGDTVRGWQTPGEVLNWIDSRLRIDSFNKKV